MISGRSRAFLAAAALAAVAAPVGLRALLHARLQHTTAALSATLGAEVSADDAEVGLGGTFTLHGVRVGDVLAADAVEAAVGLTHLMSGTFVADEVRVARPRLHARVRDGHLEVGDLLQRAGRRGAAPHPGERRLRRILVTGGELELTIEDAGVIHARDVELHPQEGGVRVVTGPISAELRHGGLEASATFARAGLDVELPALRARRAALDGGRVTVGDGLTLEDVVVVRDGTTRVEGHIAGAGPVALAVEPDAVSVEVDRLPLAPLAALLPPWLGAAGRVSGHIHASRSAPFLISAAIRADGVSVRHPLLASAPLPFTGAVAVDGSWDPAGRAGEGRVRLESGRLVVAGDVTLALDEHAAPLRAAVHAELPTLPCADALAALPAPVRAPLVGLDLAGDLGGRAEIAFDLAHPDDARFDLDLNVGCRVLRDGSSAAVAQLAGPYVHELPGGGSRVLGPDDPDFVSLRKLPSWVPGAFVAAEDGRFFKHNGFDAEQIQRSFTIDVAAGRVERGGSTISQQLVKNLFLTRERTLARKLVEAVLTWNLEQRVPKARILEAYLNVIELGAGVYGIEPAARRWFGKSARRLSPQEAAFLAAITSAPGTAERRVGGGGRLDEQTLHRTEVVLVAMRRASVVHSSDLRSLLAELPSLRLHAQE